MTIELSGYFPLVFGAGWIAICAVLAVVSGWRDLAQKYSARQPPEGEKFRFRNANMRYTASYNGCVTFTANAHGLGMSVLFLFRIGHPPLFIPWFRIEISEERRYFMRSTKFLVRDADVPIWVSKRLGDAICPRPGNVTGRMHRQK